mmetsp:Transcript_58881/g.137997  ORF Transcript_58881/g.137997 Transcript_58881/m.137997 type:complete len:253 (+) Transcript_58881:327-1085(+)
MRLLPLVRAAPTHAAHLSAWKHPARVAVKNAPEVLHMCLVAQVHKCISQVRFGPEIYGEIEEVVLALEALLVHHCRHHGPVVIVGEIAQHDGRSGLRAPRRLRGGRGSAVCWLRRRDKAGQSRHARHDVLGKQLIQGRPVDPRSSQHGHQRIHPASARRGVVLLKKGRDQQLASARRHRRVLLNLVFALGAVPGLPAQQNWELRFLLALLAVFLVDRRFHLRGGRKRSRHKLEASIAVPEVGILLVVCLHAL